MKKQWFTNLDNFSALTTLLKGSLRGGIITRTENNAALCECYEEGVEEGWVTKDALFSCKNSSCGKSWDYRHVPDHCICGANYPEEAKPTEPQRVCYFVRSVFWEEHLQPLIPVEQFELDVELVWEKTRGYDNVTLGQLNASSPIPRMHISPYYGFGGEEIYRVADNGVDIFIDWNMVPFLVKGTLDLPETVMN